MVYVDDMRAKFGRLVMCHMVADTDAELHAMADRIGVARRWFQQPPKVRHSHYDICLSKRALAVAAGAKEITVRETAEICRAKLKPRTCRLCGCTDACACPGGCWWVEDDLCSACQRAIDHAPR
jgi:hypothetical protein